MSLNRKLNARQLNMIALGGTIGTGLFLASGGVIATAGTLGAIIGYLITGTMVYFLMSSLGEMTAYRPVTGSFCEYSSSYVSPSFGFAMSINYWFNWAITIAAEITAGTIILQFWFPGVSPLIVGFMMVLIIILLNLFSVNLFGESEYWLSVIKVGMVIIFVIIGSSMILGLNGSYHNYLISSNSRLNLFNHQSWLSIFNVFLIAGFAFQGSELFGIAAGECENPEKVIPKAAKMIFIRILLFYILTIFIIGCLIPSTDPHLVNNSEREVAYSPFTMVITMAHVHFAASIINFVLLSAVISAANSGTYAASRILYQLGNRANGFLAIFSKTTQQGVPVMAILATLAVGCMTFILSYCSKGNFYMILVSASSLSGFIAWVGIAVSHIFFRREFQRDGGNITQLPYLSKFHPYGTWAALLLCITILLGQNYTTFLSNNINWIQVFLTYSSLIVFLMFWLGYAVISWFKSYRSNRLCYGIRVG